jgi:hypothetical protein
MKSTISLKAVVWVSWQLVAASLVGCSTNAPVVASTGPTASQACGDSARTRCSKYATCQPLGETMRYADDATCVARETLACMNALAAPGTGNSPQAVRTVWPRTATSAAQTS